MPSSEPTEPSEGALKRGGAIRDPGFGYRFEEACLAKPECPPLHQGRLRWSRDEFQRRFGEHVTTNAIAQWNIGAVKPGGKRIDRLAEILDTNRNWLYFGNEVGSRPRDRRDRSALATGAVNLVAGLIQLDGGTIAFPDDDDSFASAEHVDLHAIIRGKSYGFHIALGEKTEQGWYRFDVPIRHLRVIVLGLVRDGLTFRLVKFPRSWIEQYRAKRGSTAEIRISASDIVAMKIADFSKRL